MTRMHGVAVGICVALFAVSAAATAQQDHRDQRRGQSRHEVYRPPAQHRPAAARPGWYQRGGRVPNNFRGPRFVVNNWHAYHLSAPPRGYHWVRGNNGDFLLVAVATGLISSIVAGMLAPPPPGVVPAAPVAGPVQYEYFCPAANAYYPYVATCPMPWQPVAVPPPAY